MKKLLLLVVAVIASMLSAQAASITYEKFGTDWTPVIPSTASKNESTHKDKAGKELKIKNVKIQKNGSNAALFLTKSTGVVTIPAMSDKVSKITLYSMTQASKRAVVEIKVGTKSLGTVALNEVGVDKSFPLLIQEADQAVNVEYTISATGAANVQIYYCPLNHKRVSPTS